MLPFYCLAVLPGTAKVEGAAGAQTDPRLLARSKEHNRETVWGVTALEGIASPSIRVPGVSGAFSWRAAVFSVAQMLVALVLPFPVCCYANNTIMKTQDGDKQNTFCSRESGREDQSQSDILLSGHFREE